MDKNEPALVPEWLRTTTSDNTSSLVRKARRRNLSDFDPTRSVFLDWSPWLNSPRSSSNGSAKHAYSSFSTSRRDKDRDRDRDKDRTSFGNYRSHDSSDPLDILTGRFEKLGGSEIDRLHQPAEPSPQRVAVGSGHSNRYTGNGPRSRVTVASGINKGLFEKDFPSLGTEERQGMPRIARLSSPAPGTVSTSDSGSLTTGLNMAEALAQAPSQTHTSPKLSVKTKRSEELAIKQSRQLIPVTPPTPKGLILSSVDKSKAKPAGRTNDTNITPKSGHRQYSSTHHGNQSPHNGHIKPDMPKTGKLLVLKPGWENEVSLLSQKDVASPTTNTNSKVTTRQNAVFVVSSASARNLNNTKLSAVERKAAPNSNPVSRFTVEKKPSLAQTRSRNDFFNLLKKKTSTNSSAGLSDSDPHISSPTTEKSEVSKEVVNASNGGTCQDAKRFSDDDEKDISAAMFYPDEKEAAFLRSLGWEENYGDDEGLTEEEINAFHQEVMKLSPSLKLCSGLLQKLAQSFATDLDGASSESSSSDSIF